MNFKQSLRAQIPLSDPSLANKVYGAMPTLNAPAKFVVYTVVGGEALNHLTSNPAPGSTVKLRRRVQLAAYADSDVDAETIQLKLHADLTGFAGVLGGVGGVVVDSFLPVPGQDRSGWLENVRRFYSIKDYEVMYAEILP